MLLGKALLLGLLGGVLGYVAGTAAGMAMGPAITGLEVKPVLLYLPLAVLLSMGAALLGCLVPAWLAGRIEPFSNLQEV
jgi:ABC-type antimicrobial peptide transport system permease subunit